MTQPAPPYVVGEGKVSAHDGKLDVRWRVPRDLAVSEYVLRFQAAPLRLCEAEVSGLKIAAPLDIARVGRDEVQVSWSAGALPTEAATKEGWRLAVDVLPVAAPGEVKGCRL